MTFHLTFPIIATLTILRRDPCLTSSSPAVERLRGSQGGELRLSLGKASVYLSRGLLPRV